MMPEKEKVEIRRVEAEDAAWKKQFDAFYANCPRPKLIPATPHAYFAAYHGDEMVAHSVVYKKRLQWMLDGLRVKPEWRQQGIGKALTTERIRYAVKNGAKEIRYDCEDGNLVTTCCHLRFGFQKVCPRGRSCAPAKVHRYCLKVTADLLEKLDI